MWALLRAIEMDQVVSSSSQSSGIQDQEVPSPSQSSGIQDSHTPPSGVGQSGQNVSPIVNPRHKKKQKVASRPLPVSSQQPRFVVLFCTSYQVTISLYVDFSCTLPARSMGPNDIG